MAIDAGLWAWIQPVWKTIKGLHVERVENTVASGTPDVDGCYQSSAFKIELKRGVTFKTNDEVEITFRKSQPGWLKSRWNAGGNAWVLIKTGMAAKMKVYLIRGCDIGKLRTVGEKSIWRTNERHLSDISVIAPNAKPEDILRAAAGISF